MCCIGFLLSAQDKGGVSSSEMVVIIGDSFNLESYVKKYVEGKIVIWQQKDEWERTSDYEKRVSEQSRSEKAKGFAAEAIENLKHHYSQTIDWKAIIIGMYDADNEVFPLIHPKIINIYIPVDFESAPSFKSNANKLIFENAEYSFSDKGFTLVALEITNPENGKKYYYSNDHEVVYEIYNIDFNFSDLEYTIPEERQRDENNAIVKERNMNIGKDPVDIQIPLTNTTSTECFAVVIGNEHYENERDVPYAINDAITFQKYLIKTLGIPVQNIYFQDDADFIDFERSIQWITDVALAHKGKASLIFYYAGHGMPDKSSGDAFLLPANGFSDNPQYAIKLDDLYSDLGKVPCKQVTVLLDACFSGVDRNGLSLSEGRAVRIKPNEGTLKGNMVVLSATTDKQIAYPYDDKGHGLFTYYVLKKLQESEGLVTLGELSEYLIDNVNKTSIIYHKAYQTPKVILSEDVKEDWKELKLTK